MKQMTLSHSHDTVRYIEFLMFIIFFNPNNSPTEEILQQDCYLHFTGKQADSQRGSVIEVTELTRAEQDNKPWLLGSWRDLAPRWFPCPSVWTDGQI